MAEKKKLNWKRLGSLLMLATILCAVFSPGRAGAAAQPAKAYTFHAAVGDGLADSARTMYYTPDYFTQSATQYNPQLATASLCMAMSAFGSNQVYLADNKYDFTKANVNWLELFRDKLSFSDVRTNAYFTQKTRTDNVGFGMAWTYITATASDGSAYHVPLIAVGVRGSNYMSEWASNVNVGSSGDHAGFSQAANIVINGVKEYINSIPALRGQRVKLWISGFSRAAATSNMVGGYLDEAILDGSIEQRLGASLTKDDLYCYTFETPAGTVKPQSIAHGETYSNIFNLINPNDLVPKVAPYFPDAAFIRYGTDLCFPSSITSLEYESYEGNMKKVFLSLNPKYTYILDQFKNYRLSFGWEFACEDDVSMPNNSAAEFCSRFIGDLAAEGIKTRSNYVKKYQSTLQVLMNFLCGSGEEFGGKANQQKFFAYFSERGYGLIWTYLKEFFTTLKWPMEDVRNATIALLGKACKEAGVTLTDDYKKLIGTMVGNLFHELMTDSLSANIRETNYLLTLYKSVSNILQAHDPDVCYAWLVSMDENYRDTTNVWQSYKAVLNSGEYRTVTLTGVTTAAVQRMVNNSPIGNAKTYTAGVVMRQLRILLPTDGAYRLDIHSPFWNGSYSFNYAVSEYSSAINGVKRIFSYRYAVKSYTPAYKYAATIGAFSADQVRRGIPQGSELNYTLSFKNSATPIKDASVNRLLADIRGPEPYKTDIGLSSSGKAEAVDIGDRLDVTVSATGETLNYQWFVRGNASDAWQAVSGQTYATLHIDEVKKDMIGSEYRCLIYDLYGSETYTDPVTIRKKSPITGDSSNPMRWVLLLLFSAAGIAALARHSSRRQTLR